MEGAVRKSRNGRSSGEEQEWKDQLGRAGLEGEVRKAGMEGAQRKNRNGWSNEEEQEWREQ